mmetsp:Transcript_4629/g.3833  ORF Transcript_4629/g.3833 Transcript_4629/m.3833 type:complete len:83 (-) Transcript_4629:194-442(-)
MHKIKIPYFILQAKDDPVSDYKGIPEEVHETNENLMLMFTEKGGHQGWVEGIFIPETWYHKPAFDFLNAAVALKPDFEKKAQ